MLFLGDMNKFLLTLDRDQVTEQGVGTTTVLPGERVNLMGLAQRSRNTSSTWVTAWENWNPGTG